jgi:hypothetical protein
VGAFSQEKRNTKNPGQYLIGKRSSPSDGGIYLMRCKAGGLPRRQGINPHSNSLFAIECGNAVQKGLTYLRIFVHKLDGSLFHLFPSAGWLVFAFSRQLRAG